MRHWTVKRVVTTLVALLVLTGFSPATFPTSAADDLLAGRLGGTLTSFEKLYGSPVSGTPEQGADFKVPDFGMVFVQFKLAPDPDRPNRISTKTTPDSPAIVIALSAPRRSSQSGTVPDKGDWSLDEAKAAVRKFLPTDVELGPLAVDGSSGLMTCQSDALTKVLPSATNACRIVFVLPTPSTVSYATLVLAPVEASNDGPRNPCTGLASWSSDTSARLATAQDLLGQLAAIDESDPEATTKLTQISSDLTDLASDQRSAETPPVADRVRDLLVDAFTSYADAATAASQGIATNDSTKIDDAVASIASAEETIGRATALLQRALTSCGLSGATPVATESGT